MIDFTKTPQANTQDARPDRPTATPPPGMDRQSQGTPVIPDQYQGWNPGAQYQISPYKWDAWGGGDTWQQGWYRDPSDPGHVVYNQDLGYQDWQDVFGGGDMTANWDLSRFDDRIADTQAAQTQGNQNTWGNDWQQQLQQYFQNYAQNWGQQGGQPQANTQAGPSERPTGDSGTGRGGQGMGTYDWREPLSQAQNTLGQFAGGMPYNAPWQWGQASDVASQFAEGGSPVDYQGFWDAQQPVLQRTIEDQAKQQAESLGVGGARWSTPLQRNISDIAGRETAGAFQEHTGRALQGQEMAKQRQQQAVNQLQGLGQGYVGLEDMMRQQQMQAAGMLPGLSQTGYGIQSDIARNLMQGGMGQQGMNQQALGNLLNIFGQQNPTLAMLLQGGMGGLGTPSNWAQQQYSQSPFSQFLSGILPF